MLTYDYNSYYSYLPKVILKIYKSYFYRQEDLPNVVLSVLQVRNMSNLRLADHNV